jgi:hypothetical protein
MDGPDLSNIFEPKVDKPNNEPKSRSTQLCVQWRGATGGAVHIVMLGSYAEHGEGSEQHTWLRRDLTAVERQRTQWLVVLIHMPCYNTSQAH